MSSTTEVKSFVSKASSQWSLSKLDRQDFRARGEGRLLGEKGNQATMRRSREDQVQETIASGSYVNHRKSVKPTNNTILTIILKRRCLVVPSARTDQASSLEPGVGAMIIRSSLGFVAVVDAATRSLERMS